MTYGVEEYERRTPKGKAAWERAAKLIPGGVGSAIQFKPPYPLYLGDSKGSRVWDLDGNEYIDYSLCYAAMVAGHANPIIVEAITKQAAHGTLYGLPTTLAGDLAEEIVRRYAGVDRHGPVHAVRRRGDADGDPARSSRHRSQDDREDRGAIPRRHRPPARVDRRRVGGRGRARRPPERGRGLRGSPARLHRVHGGRVVQRHRHDEARVRRARRRRRGRDRRAGDDERRRDPAAPRLPGGGPRALHGQGRRDDHGRGEARAAGSHQAGPPSTGASRATSSRSRRRSAAGCRWARSAGGAS